MSMDKTWALSLKEGSDHPCAERQAPSSFYGLYFMLLRDEKLGRCVLRTEAIPGAGRLVLLTAGYTLMVPMKAPIVPLQIPASEHDGAPGRGAGSGSRAVRLLPNLSLLLTSAKGSRHVMGPASGVC